MFFSLLALDLKGHPSRLGLESGVFLLFFESLDSCCWVVLYPLLLKCPPLTKFSSRSVHRELIVAVVELSCFVSFYHAGCLDEVFVSLIASLGVTMA